jgi:murein DD-endopeptidase MepM/ murein hydrolase activator NlpD
MGYNPAQSRPGAAWITQMFGNVAIPADFEFNIPSTNNLYGYGASYGMNGTNHTGIDVPLPVNTPYYAPLSGIVTCAGTGYGSGADGGGCAAFGDDFGSGAGRVEVQLSNGVVLIYGHSSKSLLKPGDTFQAGQQIGTSGGQLSPHIHLEARVRDASTPSGWNNAPSGGYNQAPQSGGAWWQNVDPGTVAAKIQSGGW